MNTMMKSAYFSPSLLMFFPEEWKDDGTYSESAWPSDAVILNQSDTVEFWKQSPPSGQQLGTINGLPAWVDIPPPPPLTREQVEVFRLRSYADQLTGSDRLFAEASRMQLMGEADFESVRVKAISRYMEIQAAYPWP